MSILRPVTRHLARCGFAAMLAVGAGGVAAAERTLSLEARRGERLFFETRFANPAATSAGMSCARCHLPPGRMSAKAGSMPVAFCDRVARSPIPRRDDGRSVTPRNTPSLFDSVVDDAGSVFHFDGEFATAEELVRGTFLGRNYGWLATERADAVRHFAAVVRADRTDETPGLGLDLKHLSDDQLVDACARLVVAYLRTLRLSRDEGGQYDGSPFDAFLAANRLPRGPAEGETARNYARRLAELIATLSRPVFVAPPERRLRSLERPFVFGPEELRGLRIFMKSAVGQEQKGGAGNCAECHLPPRFTDLSFHNTGVAQAEYDAVHGAGAFARLPVPTLAERAAEPDRWLEPTPTHPHALGRLLARVDRDAAVAADLGLWNVYANPDFASVQPALERMLNPGGQRSREAVLATCIGSFKTSPLRGLGGSAPYLHTGAAATLAEVVDGYRRASEFSRLGRLRNAPPEFFGMRLQPEDTAPLVAFLQSLNEEMDDRSLLVRN